MAGETSALAKYIVGTGFEKLPLDVVAQAKTVILDTLGVLLADSRLELGEIIIGTVREWGGTPEATVVGGDYKTSCTNAALVNGTLGHGDEMDDAHNASYGHPAAVMVPAALAVAERQGSTGKDLINAVVLGYDVGCRVSIAMDPVEMKRRGYHPSCVCGSFGAVAVAGRLLDLAHEQAIYALALTGSQASGVMGWMTEAKHMSKSFQTGVAARNGVAAALLASLGYEGPKQVIEGRLNVFEAFTDKRDYGRVLEGLGSYYEIMRTSLKKYSAGHPIHGPLDGLLQILGEQKLNADDIAEITVWMAPGAANTVDGRDTLNISIHNLLSIAIYERKMEIEQSHSETLAQDPRVQAMRQRIKVVRDEELGKEFPAKAPSRIEVATTDGRKFRQSREYSPGEPENPLTRQEVVDKFMSLSSPVIGKAKAEKLLRLVDSLESVGDVRDVGGLLRV